MDAALITSAALLGLAGTPHCAAMCAAPCAAATAGQGRAGMVAFQLARVASYGLAGAVAASSVGALAAWAQMAPALRPLWTMLHAGAFALGLWLLWQGRQPAWMGRWGRMPTALTTPTAPTAQTMVFSRGLAASGSGAGSAPDASFDNIARQSSPWRALTAGALWAAWPCGLLQSALLVAALTGGAAAGASAMALFALASSAGLLLGPWAWRRWLSGPGAARRERWLARLGGGMLAAASAWALSHDLWHRFAVWCGLA